MLLPGKPKRIDYKKEYLKRKPHILPPEKIDYMGSKKQKLKHVGFDVSIHHLEDEEGN